MNELDKQWAEAAIAAELATIDRLSSTDKPPKLTHPNSAVTLSILKVASVVNGYGMNPNNAYTRILYALRCHPVSSKPREIEYQWKRCLQRAHPRRRSVDSPV